MCLIIKLAILGVALMIWGVASYDSWLFISGVVALALSLYLKQKWDLLQ